MARRSDWLGTVAAWVPAQTVAHRGRPACAAENRLSCANANLSLISRAALQLAAQPSVAVCAAGPETPAMHSRCTTVRSFAPPDYTICAFISDFVLRFVVCAHAFPGNGAGGRFARQFAAHRRLRVMPRGRGGPSVDGPLAVAGVR